MNRRDFLALSSATLIQPNAKSPTPPPPIAPPRPAGQTKPNILLIMADQLRMDCVGAYGNKAIHTPHLDRIAREGTRFNNAYTCVPSCTPARTALMTGLGPWKNGMLGYGTMATKPYPIEKAKALADAGYYTTSVGKNHYFPIANPHGYHHLISDEHCTYWFHNKKDNEPQSPEYRCDYESFFWSQRPTSDPHATGLGWNDQPAKPFAYAEEELHPTHWTGTTAVRFLEQYERPEPFFLKVSFIRPHSPYDPPQRCWDMYKDATLPEPQAGEWASRFEERSDPGLSIWHGKLSPEEVRNSRQGYYGSVTFVDEQIGRILTALEQRHMLDDTMIIFFSDHGDMLGDQNLWRKTYGYEQSAHIPMLIKPAAQQHLAHAPKTVDSPVEIRDIVPTLLDAAQATIPSGLDGDSMCKLLRDPQTKWREYIDLEHNQIFGPSNHWNGLTDGKWKYIFHAPTGEEQLFHLTEDRNELHDLAKDSAHAETLTLWRGRLVEHLTERGPDWVQDGKLQLRKKPQLYSPNFPGWDPASYQEKTIRG